MKTSPTSANFKSVIFITDGIELVDKEKKWRASVHFNAIARNQGLRICITFVRICIQLFTLIWIRIQLFALAVTADPDPAPHKSDKTLRPLIYRTSNAPFYASSFQLFLFLVVSADFESRL
jgi:hypothetical protein